MKRVIDSIPKLTNIISRRRGESRVLVPFSLYDSRMIMIRSRMQSSKIFCIMRSRTDVLKMTVGKF